MKINKHDYFEFNYEVELLFIIKFSIAFMNHKFY